MLDSAPFLPDIAIAPPDKALRAAVLAEIGAKTKPPGSLGRIEDLALRLALAQGAMAPRARPARLLLFAADHGLVTEGVSAWPQEVTAQMVLNFLSGGAASNVFARAAGVGVEVIDAGVATDLPDHPDLRRAGVARGARNSAAEDAMTAEEAAAALRYGATRAEAAADEGVRVLLLGEMGIGNTAAAALLAAKIAGLDLAGLTGPGAGAPAGGVQAKRAILLRAAERRPGRLPPADALAAYGGLEIAAMAGALIGGAARRMPVLVDGFIATAAAMTALAARPEAAHYAIFAHRSGEPGHATMLDHLGAEPLLDLGLRLGEGTGALLALPLLDAAARMLCEMATFESAGVSGAS